MKAEVRGLVVRKTDTIGSDCYYASFECSECGTVTKEFHTMGDSRKTADAIAGCHEELHSDAEWGRLAKTFIKSVKEVK